MRRLSSSSYFPCSRVLRSLKERGSAESTAPCRTDLLPQHSSGSGKMVSKAAASTAVRSRAVAVRVGSPVTRTSWFARKRPWAGVSWARTRQDASKTKAMELGAGGFMVPTLGANEIPASQSGDGLLGQARLILFVGNAVCIRILSFFAMTSGDDDQQCTVRLIKGILRTFPAVSVNLLKAGKVRAVPCHGRIHFSDNGVVRIPLKFALADC